jgi:hypothetical protein
MRERREFRESSTTARESLEVAGRVLNTIERDSEGDPGLQRDALAPEVIRFSSPISAPIFDMGQD